MTDRQYLWETADAISEEDGRLVQLLCSYWPWHNWPADCGEVVIFSRLAIDTARDFPRHAMRALGAYLTVEFGRRTSFMALKCFPLEFESALPEGDEGRALLFDRRLKAMQRHYNTHLGVRTLSPSDPEWMWRSFRHCPDPLPAPRPDWRDEDSE